MMEDNDPYSPLLIGGIGENVVTRVAGGEHWTDYDGDGAGCGSCRGGGGGGIYDPWAGGGNMEVLCGELMKPTRCPRYW